MAQDCHGLIKEVPGVRAVHWLVCTEEVNSLAGEWFYYV